jgi:succinate dehydrogenase/fumarate reductase flavoprotein subunit
MQHGKRVVVIGGEAAGMSAASQARRQRPDLQIVAIALLLTIRSSVRARAMRHLACLHPPAVPPTAGVVGCAWPTGDGGLSVERRHRLVRKS